MSSLRLPFVPLDTRAAPKVVDRATWAAACDELLVREKANLRESDALAAARRRLPMTPVPRDVQVVGRRRPRAAGQRVRRTPPTGRLLPHVARRTAVGPAVRGLHVLHRADPAAGVPAQSRRHPGRLLRRDLRRRAGRTPTSCRTGCPGGRPGEPTGWSPDGTSDSWLASCATATMSTRRGGPPVAARRRWPGATTCWTVRSTAGRRAGRTRRRVGRSRSAWRPRSSGRPDGPPSSGA